MRTLVTRILWLAAAGALLYGGFVAYERWWDGDLSLVKDRVLSFVNENAEETKDRAVEAGSEALESAKEEATQAAKNAIASAVGGVIESIGETITQYGESVAGGSPAASTVPAASGPAFSVPPPPVALSTKVGETLTFVVNEVGRYIVKWSDGTTDEGEVAEDGSVLLRHAWSAIGDYTITLTTASHVETFPVRIYE